MDLRRVPISVNVNPSEYSGRSIRLGGNSDVREKMQQKMQEFEEESRKWRDQFLTTSGLNQGSVLDHRPRMFFNYNEFPELSLNFSPLSSSGRLNSIQPSSGFFGSSVAPFSQTAHNSFIEEDDHGIKKYKMVFDIGDFKPDEIQVKTEGRQLVVKGDRELIAGSSTESKQFNREVTLPDFVEPTAVTSFLSDGKLTLEAPVLLDRLGYLNSGNNSNSITTSASSTLRHSPFRDNTSPSRTTVSSLLSSPRSFRKSREDLFNNNGGIQQSINNSFSTPFFNDNALNSNINSTLATYKFNMSEFRPEDIAITVTDTTLKVHAVREENDSRGNGKTYREFKREIGLPQGADVKRLKNSLQSDGTLNIEIPVNDNLNLRPPLSPTGINKQFGNFSLNDNNSISTNNSINNGALLNSNSGLIDQSNNGKELKLTFDLTGYKPEDLSIKVIDNNTLKIHAVHIDNTRGNQIHREYTRQYTLPDWVQPELLRARMSENGTLTVEIPVSQMQPSKLERVISIQNTSH